MRFSSVLLAMVAAGTIATLAQAQTGPAMKEDTGSMVNTQGAPGIRAGQPANPTLAPEQRTRIRQYVVEHHVAPVTLSQQVTVGATLPADVALTAVPSDWGPNLTSYRYVYSGNHVVLVEPSTRRVIQVIE
jgi:Protein of unknown function (DUF1236)